MAGETAQWEESLRAAKVPEALRKALVAEGYVSQALFMDSVCDETELEAWLMDQLHGAKVLGDEVPADKVKRHPASGALRGLWRRSKSTGEAQAVKPLQSLGAVVPSEVKIDDAKWRQLKQDFNVKCPHELTSKRRLPGKEVMALLLAMNKDGRMFKWLSWSSYISLLLEEKRQESAMPAAKKRKLDVSDEHGLMLVELEDNDAESQSVSFLGSASLAERVLELRARAFAMAGQCGLLVSRLYNEALMEFHYEEQADATQRSPSLLELVHADKRALEVAFDIVQEEGWTLDKALAHVAAPGGELWRHLRPRAKSTVVAAKGAGKGKWSGDSAGAAAAPVKQQAPASANETLAKAKVDKRNWAKKSDDNRQYCFAKHERNMCKREGCKLAHKCPLLIKGRACNRRHAAVDCDQFTR